MSIMSLSILFWGSVAWSAGESASNRKDQTVRLGMKTGIHLMYAVSQPYVFEIPGEDWTFGLVYGSGDLVVTSTTTTTKDIWKFSTSELTGRYYIGNSFNIPFGIAMYNIHLDDWDYLGVDYELDYSMTQLNFGIGNEWTYDWGGYFGIDWYQGGSKISDEVTVKLKSGTETAATKSKALSQSTDIQAFGGVFVMTFGFGF